MAQDDLGDQLSIQQQINKVLAKRQALMARSTKVLGAQVKMATELCNALDCKNLDGMNDRLQEINASLSEVAETASTAAEKTNGLAEAAEGAGGGFGKFTDKLPLLGGALGLLGGVGSAFKGIWSMVKGLGKALFSVIGSVFKLGTTLLMMPVKMFEGLIGMAQQGGGGSPVIKQALEEIRKEMGALTSGEGKAVASTLGNVRKQMGNLAGTGLSVRRVFGAGRAGVAAAIKDAAETAKAMGSAFSALKDDFAKNSVAIGMFKKGLGLTAEQMAKLAKRALASGRSITSVATEITSYSQSMSDQFGISAKLISKDMGVMMEDFEHFGTLGPKVMSQVSVFTRKLGIEVKDLTGLIDGFDNFEDAAKGASQLAQAFGMNVDAMKMMKEQDPGKRLSMLQQAFKATGKSVESMSRQELKMLAGQSNLSMEAAKLAFSQKGLGMSYDKIAKGGDNAKKKQLTQAQAMSKLADSIERVFGSGGASKFKGFFDAFSQGFGKGITRSKEFRKIMRNIRKSLKVIYRAGMRVGKAFVKFFPGVKKLFKGLADLFSPKKFKKLGNGLVKAFTDLFKSLKDNPKAGVATFIDYMKNLFGKFFGGQGGALTMIKEGFHQIMKAIVSLAAAAIPYIKDAMIDGIKALTEFIRNPKKYLEMAGAGAAGAGGFIMELFAPILEAIIDNESGDSGVTGALKELFTTVWDDLGPPVMEAIKKFGKTVLAYGILTVVTSVLTGLVVGSAVKLILNGIKKMFTGAPACPEPGPAPPPAGQNAVVKFFEDLGAANVDWKKALKNLAWMTLAMGGVMVGLAVAMVIVAAIMSTVPFPALAKGLLAMGVMVPLMIAVVTAANSIHTFQESTMMRAMKIIAVAGLMVVAMGILGSFVARAWANTPMSIGDLGIFAGMMTVLLSVVGAVAIGAVALKSYPEALIMKGLKVLGIVSIGVLAVAAIAGAIALIPFDPTRMDAMGKFIPILFGTILVVTAGALGVGTLLAAFPLAAAGLAIGLGVVGGVAVAVGALTALFIGAFDQFSEDQLKKAMLGAQISMQVVEAVAVAISTALAAGLAVMLGAIVSFVFGGQNPIERGFTAIEEVVDLFAAKMPGIIINLIAAVRGADPATVKNAGEMLEKIMKALEPMMKVQMAAIALAGSFRRTNPEKLTKMFKAMSEFSTGPMKELNGFIETMKEMSGTMTKTQSTAVGAIAALVGGAAQFLGAMTGPMSELMKASVSTFEKFDDDPEQLESRLVSFNPAAFKQAMSSMAEHMPTIMSGMATALSGVITSFANLSLTQAQLSNLEDIKTVIGPAMKAMASAVSAMTGIMKMMGGEMAKAITQMGSSSHGDRRKGLDKMKEQLYGMDVMLFGTEGKEFVIGIKSHRGKHVGLFYGKSKGMMQTMMYFISKTAEIAKSSGAFAAMGGGTAEKLGKMMGAMASTIRLISSASGAALKTFGGMPDKKTWGAMSSDERKDYLVKLSEGIATFVGALGTSIETIFTKVKAMLDKVPAGAMGKGFTAKLKAFTQIVGLITPLGEVMKGIGSIATGPPPSGDAETKAKALGTTATEAAAYLTTLAPAIAASLKSILEAFTGTTVDNKGKKVDLKGILSNPLLKNPRNLTRKVKALGAMMGVVGTMTSAISKISEMNKGGPGRGKPGSDGDSSFVVDTTKSQDALADAVTLLSDKNFEKVLILLAPLATKVAALPYVKTSRFDILSKMQDGLVKITEWDGDHTKITAFALAVKTATDSMPEFGIAIGKLPTKEAATGISNLSSLVGILERIGNGTTTSGGVLTLAANMNDLPNLGAKVADFVKKAETPISQMQSTVDSIGGLFVAKKTKHIAKFAQHFKPGEITIKTQGIVANVYVTVKLAAKDIAKGIVEVPFLSNKVKNGQGKIVTTSTVPPTVAKTD